jgi:L-rhamnose mutarotase
MKIRKAFVMSVYPDFAQEYEKRHNPIWPELEKVLKDHGVSNYSIFLHHETRQLFGYAEIESEEQWASIASTEICQRWWKHMGSRHGVEPGPQPGQCPVARDVSFGLKGAAAVNSSLEKAKRDHQDCVFGAALGVHKDARETGSRGRIAAASRSVTICASPPALAAKPVFRGGFVALP